MEDGLSFVIVSLVLVVFFVAEGIAFPVSSYAMVYVVMFVITFLTTIVFSALFVPLVTTDPCGVKELSTVSAFVLWDRGIGSSDLSTDMMGFVQPADGDGVFGEQGCGSLSRYFVPPPTRTSVLLLRPLRVQHMHEPSSCEPGIKAGLIYAFPVV